MNGSGAIVSIMLNAGSPQARMVAKGLPASEIAIRLAGMVGHPVIDKTGLAGKFDFTLEFTPNFINVQVHHCDYPTEINWILQIP